MRIRSCETVAVQVDFEGVMRGTHIVLRLRADDGLEGVSYISRVNARNQHPLRLLLQSMAGNLFEQELDIAAVCARLYRSAMGAPLAGLELRAASAIEVAAWDLCGKIEGQPLHRLLGGTRTHVPVSANWRLAPGQDAATLASHIAMLQRRGFRALKCPVGAAPLPQAIAHVRYVRQCAGPAMRIIVDGNFSWTIEQALQFAHATEDCDLFWIEDPLAPHDFEGLRQFTAAVSQHTCAGEVFQQFHEFERLIAGHCADHMMIDQDIGILGFMRVARLAAEAGMPVINHLAPEILAHCVAAAPNGLIVGLVPWAQPLFVEPLRVVAGQLVLPQTPGLGLVLDQAMLQQCALP